ncbi:hypothetical protein BDR07DRAFT_1604129 [Suillus spraguei]|nr:hypothetical protein BDR07DRAFT_1604129 [Suillus spraguei]
MIIYDSMPDYDDSVISLLESGLRCDSTYETVLHWVTPTVFFTFPATDLIEFNILFTGQLILKPNLDERVAATTFLGQNELWSSINMYRQFVPKGPKRLLVHGLMHSSFCASAMLPLNKAMILNMEQVVVVPATTISLSSLRTLGELVDYTAIVADKCDVRKSGLTYLNLPGHCFL